MISSPISILFMYPLTHFYRNIVRVWCIFFFFLIEKKLSQSYSSKSNWNTSSKSSSNSFNHTSVSVAKTTLEWANLLPPSYMLKITELHTDFCNPNVFNDVPKQSPIWLGIINSRNNLQGISLHFRLKNASLLAKLRAFLAASAGTISTDL